MFSFYFDLLYFKLLPALVLQDFGSDYISSWSLLIFTSDMLKGISLKTTNYFFNSLITFLKQYNYINQLHHIKTQYLHM